MAQSIAEIMNMNTDDVPERQSLPAGEYRFRIQSYKPDTVKNDKATPFTRLNLKPIEVVESSEEVDLDNVDFLQHDMWMSEKSQPIVKRWFKETLGIDPAGRSFRELFEECLGQEFVGIVEINLEGRNKDRPTPRIKRFKSA